MTVSNSVSLGAALLVAALVGYLVHWGFSGTISINLDKGFKITVTQDQSLADVFEEALKESSDRVAVILANYDYYKFDSEYLRRAFATLDPTAASTNVVLAQLWQQSLARESIFVQRRFPAIVALMPHVAPDTSKIFTCSGGVLSNDYIVDILTATRSVRSKIDQDPDYLKWVDCDMEVVTAQKLLAKTVPVRFWLSQDVYNRLYPDAADGPQNAQFVVYPRHLATPLPKEVRL